MSEEKELIKKRGSYKGRLTTFSNYVSTIKSSSLTTVEANELQLRIHRMETLFNSYDEVQLRLECLAETIDSSLVERDEFESQYYTVLSKAQDILASFNKRQDDLGSEGRSSRASNHKLVKLPVIQLPKFGGAYDNWLEFRDTFQSLIHSNDDIDEINKFHYLRASLEGSAAVVIQSIEFSSKNYEIAWSLLCERFNNKRLLLQNHVSAIFNIDPIYRESSVALKGIIDQLNKNLRALGSLGEPVQYWDTLLIYIVSHKLDAKSYREWEEYKGRLEKDKPISLDAFLTFMRNRADLLETLELSVNNSASRVITSRKNTPKLKAMVVQDTKHNTLSVPKCPKCSGDHYLNSCLQFLALSNTARSDLLPSLKVCYNCLRSGHYANHCKKLGCKLCKRKHNILVHINDARVRSSGDSVTGRCDNANATNNVISVNNRSAFGSDASSHSNISRNLPISPATISTLSARLGSHSYEAQDVLLSTALIKVYDNNNREHVARAVLDSGSTSCLITKSLCKKLSLPTNNVNNFIQGINNSSSKVGKMCQLAIKSLNDTFSTSINCFVLPSITDDVPCRKIDIRKLNIPFDICLADPYFYQPAAIDLILGADIFWDVLGSQVVKLGSGQPVLCETQFGWLVSGPINSGHVPSTTIKCCFGSMYSRTPECFNNDIQAQLTRFWQLEEVNNQSSHFSPEERQCEEHFVQNTTRLADGRFCVRLPLKQKESVLGDSFQRAKHCLVSLERRLRSKPSFKALYTDFLSEYEALGHMSEGKQVTGNEKGFFIPHHGILRESSATTKLRVVFNASSPSTSGVSLNDIQMVGPTVQDDLLSILLRFRQHRYIISSDVAKMYRQVMVHPDDRHLQQIVWRASESEPLLVHTLNTVSYGTASAPFLATRCLKQIGQECDDNRVKEVIIHDFYVDDLLTGGDDITEVQNIRRKVTAALASAGMNLRKWKSNDRRLLSEPLQSTVDLNIGNNESSKTLGLGWHSQSDELYFPIGTIVSNGNTKRDMLSVIAQVFDPLGLLSPCIITMKMLLQRLWLQKLSWDEQLSPETYRQWMNALSGLQALNNVRIPRHVICNSNKIIDLHIFSDASERAYGACVYVRSVDTNNHVLVRLLMAKSRVAPIKPTTIPRLELCGALVGAHLYQKIMTSLRVQVSSTTFWSDSTIVLGWLKMMPNRLQPFVRNRVSDILEITGSCTWRHVPTDQNPADLISRGVHASEICSLALWWSGPSFLQQDISRWPLAPKLKPCNELPETRAEISLHVTSDINSEILIDFDRFSNFLRLTRAIAYVLRFINRCRKGVTTTYLNNDELKNSLIIICRISQRESFPEYNLLLSNQNLPKKSMLSKFNVFLDENKLMRVGGRLFNSDFMYEKRHPILLQSTHRFTKLLFNYEHKRLLHAPPQLLLAIIKESYWPIGGRNLAKVCYNQCVLCRRLKGQVITPLMGNLPKSRLTPGGHAFRNVGVDYSGPLMSANRQGRGCRLDKVYVAIFICLTTKAVHLELVGNLTSSAYLSALDRFMGRRGKPDNVYSDNGTSFVGAYNELRNFLKNNCNSLAETLAGEMTQFHFIPAYAPHFGGLWEAGVKSTKYHLSRVLGNCNLTYEELNTTLVKIEALLNSRPLTPLSSHPDDFSPLTPGHFLVGRPLTSLPVKDLQDHTYEHLPRFHRIEQLRQHFWTRWSKEYVAELQHRVKWRSNQDSLHVNTLVVLKEDNLPPLKWRLGRIVTVHPGSDGISRVADVRTAAGVVRRAFSKICPLPVTNELV